MLLLAIACEVLALVGVTWALLWLRTHSRLRKAYVAIQEEIAIEDTEIDAMISRASSRATPRVMPAATPWLTVRQSWDRARVYVANAPEVNVGRTGLS